MLYSIFKNRFGDSMPASEASIVQIAHNKSLSHKYFHGYIPKNGTRLHYLEYFKQHVEDLKKATEAAEAAVKLYEELCGYRQRPTESSETEQG